MAPVKDMDLNASFNNLYSYIDAVSYLIGNSKLVCITRFWNNIQQTITSPLERNI